MQTFAKEFDETHAGSHPASDPDGAARLIDPAALAHLTPAGEAEPTPACEFNESPPDTRPADAARDRARLLVQSPHRLYFYWSFSRDPRTSLRAALGDAAGNFRPAVRLVESAGGWEGEPIALADEARSVWLDARPGRTYRAEAGFHAAGLPFIRLLSSNPVETPPACVSSESDAAAQFQIGELEFAHLLTGSGYTGATQPIASDTLASRGRLLADLRYPASSWGGTSPARKSSGDT